MHVSDMVKTESSGLTNATKHKRHPKVGRSVESWTEWNSGKKVRMTWPQFKAYAWQFNATISV